MDMNGFLCTTHNDFRNESTEAGAEFSNPNSRFFRSTGFECRMPNIPKDIFLPSSVSSDPIIKGISVQYTKSGDLLVEDQLVSRSVLNWSLSTQRKFYQKMINIQEEIEQTELESQYSKPFSKVVNLIMHKESPFEIIDRIMNTTTDAGFEQFKFIVVEN